MDVSRSVFVDIITCAAPNKKACQKFQGVSDKEVRRVLISRIDHVLGCASSELVDVLILGAFGCGVFGNSIFEVASIFEILLHEKFDDVFKKIVYAVPKLHDHDLSAIRFSGASERMRRLLNKTNLFYFIYNVYQTFMTSTGQQKICAFHKRLTCFAFLNCQI